MEKQKKSYGAIALVILLLILTIVSLILATYAWAKYTSTRTGSATAEVAAWNVDFSKTEGPFVSSASHVVSGKVAPGTNGSFTVNVTPGTTEVCFNYDIVVDNITFYRNRTAEDPAGTGDIALTDETVLGTYNNGTNDVNVKVSDLKKHIDVFYTPVAGGNDVAIVRKENATQSLPATNLHGTYGLENNAGLSGDNTVKWKWEYHKDDANYDQIDTVAGEYANAHGLKMEINYTVTAVQVQPGAQNH